MMTIKEMKEANKKITAEIYRRQNEIRTSTPKEIFLRKYGVHKTILKEIVTCAISNEKSDLLPGEIIH